MLSKNQTFSSTVTQSENPRRMLILRLRPHIEEIATRLQGLSSEEAQNKAKITRTREELQQRVDEIMEGLRSAIDNSLIKTKSAVKRMIPQRPEIQSEEAQRAYEDEMRRFELFLLDVQNVLMTLENFFERLFNKITEFYTSLWEDYNRTKKDNKKQAERFHDELAKEYSEMIKKLQNLTK